MFSLEESSSEISDDIANDIVNKINATFEGGSIHPERFTSMSFSKQLALMLGKALGQAPFKLLDEILDED